MPDNDNQLEPLLKKLLKADEKQLYEILGIREKAIESDPDKRNLIDPQVTYDEAQMGTKEEVLELGQNIFERWALETYKLACGSEDTDLEERKKLVTASGVSEVAIASAITGLLITELAVPAALAPVIAAIVVRRFFRPAYEEFCKVWEKKLPKATNE